MSHATFSVLTSYAPLVIAQADDAPPALPDDAISNSPSTPAGTDSATATTGESAAPLGPNATPGSSPTTSPAPDFSMIYIMVAVMAIFYIFVIRSQRKQKKERENMLTTIQKGARVSTVGGILGTVVEVKDDEVVLKVDESSNTKIHFSRSSVQSVIEKD